MLWRKTARRWRIFAKASREVCGRCARAETEKEAGVKAAARKKEKADANHTTWNLRLYVAGQTSKSITAFANLNAICEHYLEGQYSIEVIDLLTNPQLAKGDQIIAIPTLVRKLPEPIKKIIGDLANTERVLVGLDIRPESAAKSTYS